MNLKLAPLTGILFFGALLAAILAGSGSPNSDASGPKVLAFYTAHHDRLVASSILTVVSVAVGVVFFGLLRDYLRSNEGVRGLTATAFGGVILFAASGAVSAGGLFALTDATSHLDPAAAQSINLLTNDVNAGFACAGIAILLFAYGLAIVKSGLLPSWLGWAAFPFAAVALVPMIGFISFVATGLWVLGVSIALYLRQSKAGAAASA